MGKRRRNEHQAKATAKEFPWPILMFGGILMLAAAFLLANRAAGGSGAGGAAVAGPPQIAVDPAKIDYGYVKFGDNESFKIKVTNNGGGVLRFAEKPYIEVLEGC